MRPKPTWNLCITALATAVILLPIFSSRADDSFAPCWRNGLNSTYQSWVFTTSNNPASPEISSNSNGTAEATFTVGTFGKGWLASSFGSKTGLWELGRAGQVSVIIPNYTMANVPKFVQVQVSYFEDSLAYRPPTVSLSGATLVNQQTVDNMSAPPGTWKTQKTLWLINPATASDLVVINGDANRGLLIDQIVIDSRIAAGGDGDVPAFRPCWRGNAGSTFQHWAFGISNNPSALTPEFVTNSFGAPSIALAPGPFSSGYISEDEFLGCRQGIWDLGQAGTMTLTIPNTTSGSVNSYKYLQVAITQFRDGIYNQNVSINVPGGTLVSQQQQMIETNVFSGSWIVHKSVWRLGPPCPSTETVVLTGGTNGSLIDQIVVDTLPVEIPCPADVLASADAGQCSTSGVTWSVPTVDGCVITNVTCIPPLGSTFNVGTNSVSCTVHDGEGGVQTCGFAVVITDDEAPSIACPANMIVPRDPALCGAVVNFAPNAWDNCSGTTVVSTPPSGSVFPLGLTTVTSVAHDASGNVSAACSFTVQVIDLTGDVAAFRPCWRGAPGSTFQHWAFGSSNNPAVVPPDIATNVYGSPAAAISLGAFSSGYLEADAFLGCRQGIWDLGEQGTMTLSIPNPPAGPATSCKYVQIVVTQFRDGIYNENANVSMADGTLVSQQQQVIETNNFGGQWLAQKSVWRLVPGSAIETVVLTAGTNGALIDQIVVDTLPVDSACPTDVLASADAGQCSRSNVTWTVPAVDGCIITNVVCVPASGSTFAVGTNSVTCTAFDSHGGETVCHFSVTITDDEAPVARGTNIVANLDATGSATISAADVDGGSTDNCDIASRYVFPEAFTCSNLGSNEVVLTVVDIHGHTNTCAAIVTVHDAIPPVVSSLATILTNATSDCSQVVTWIMPSAADNCSVTNIVCVPASGSAFSVGTNTVQCTAWDSSGNTGTSSFEVIVLAQADLSVSIAASPTTVTVGSNVTYLVTVNNNGPCAASGVIVSNIFSPGLISVAISNDITTQANPWPGPVAWWRAENNANDSAGGSHGTISGATSFALSEVGQAFSFDGSTASVTIPDSSALRPTNFTVEGWIRIQDVTGLHVILGKRVGSSTMDSYSMWIGSGVLFATISDGSVSAPFMSYPEFPTSSAFGSADIVNLQSFAFKLQSATPADPISLFIKTNLSAATASHLATYTGGPNAHLQAAIANDLNRIISQGSIFETERFSAVTLSLESQYVLGRNPQGIDLVRLNRFLIRDAYPSEIASIVFPQLNQRFHVAYTFDAGSRVQALYVNGLLVNAGFTTNDIAYDTHPLLVGGDDDNGAPGYFFQGEVDELAIYNRALTGTEIRSIYRVHSAGKALAPGKILLGNIPAGDAAQFSITATATECPGASIAVSVSAATLDGNSGNNSANALLGVTDVPDSELAAEIGRVSENNNLLRLSWPLGCSPAQLETADSMNPPVLWTPILVPVLMMDDQNSTILPAALQKQFFRIRK